MPIFFEEEVAFVHIPKCAGTAIEVSFGWADKYPGIGLEPTRTEPDREHLFGSGLQHLTAKEIKINYLKENYSRFYRFSVIRDPLERLYSHYVWRNHRFKPIKRSLDEIRRELAEFVNAVWHVYAAQDVFLQPKRGYAADAENGPQGIVPNDIARHLLPQCAYLFEEGELIIDNLFAIEQLPQLYAEVRKRLPQCRPLQKRMASHSPWTSRDLFTPESIEKLHYLYRDDFAIHDELTNDGGVWSTGLGM